MIPRENTERPHAPSGVAAFMTAHSKTPYNTPSMDFPSVNGVVRGAQEAAAGVCLGYPKSTEQIRQERHTYSNSVH